MGQTHYKKIGNSVGQLMIRAFEKENSWLVSNPQHGMQKIGSTVVTFQKSKVIASRFATLQVSLKGTCRYFF